MKGDSTQAAKVFDGDFTPVIDITGVKDVNVALSGDDTDADLTPLDGTYALTASNGSNFTITPAKNINKLNGVTVADATAIQQHVASLVIITDPYKLVAADVNKSNSISTLDASIIKQALLGSQAALAQFKTSWRFVPVGYNLQAPPWGFPETIGLTSVSGSVPGQDFYGIKTGDVVSEFADPASLQARPPLVLRAQDEVLQTGQAVTTTVRTDGFDDLAAWQFALQFDPKQLALRGVKPLSGLPLSAADFGTSGLAEGELRSVWSQAEGVALDAAAQVFELQFEVKQGGGRLSDALWLDPVGGEAGELPGLAFNSGRQASAVALRFDQASGTDGPAAAEDWQLLQNQPNPFTDEMTIGFVLPAGGCRAQLRLYDAAGKLLWTADKAYPGGYSAERVRLAGITAAGVLYYELTTPFGVRTRRMVRVDP